MIQSGKFDSSYMDIKKLGNSILIFTIKRLIEIFGILILSLVILLAISLVSYSPNDPNFIFPNNAEIRNILGFQGSYVSDLFFQSFGLVSYLVPITYIFTGINIFKKKKIFLLIQNSFFIILYILIGSLFFSFYYKGAFMLYINGNGGFIGSYLSNSFLVSIIPIYENIFYYFFGLLIITLFLISINFNIKNFVLFVKNFFKLFLIETKKIILIKMK